MPRVRYHRMRHYLLVRQETKRKVLSESAGSVGTYLENRGVPDARTVISSHQAQCDSQQRSLAAKKGSATNNLAGATWEQSISSEMQAAATACDTRARELRKQLESLEKELRDLKAAGV